MGNLPGKDIEGFRPVDVRREENATGREPGKCGTKFEQLIRKGMLAVMDKEVNYPESFDQGRKLLGRFSEAQRPTVA